MSPDPTAGAPTDLSPIVWHTGLSSDKKSILRFSGIINETQLPFVFNTISDKACFHYISLQDLFTWLKIKLIN